MAVGETMTITQDVILESATETTREYWLRQIAQNLADRTFAESFGPVVDVGQIIAEIQRGDLDAAGQTSIGSGYGAIIGYYAGDYASTVLKTGPVTSIFAGVVTGMLGGSLGSQPDNARKADYLQNLGQIDGSLYSTLYQALQAGVPFERLAELAQRKNGDLEGFLEKSRSSIEQLAFTHCFPSNTPIQISPTDTAHISTLKVGDVVLAFDPKGGSAMYIGDTSASNITSLSPSAAPLIPARVTRLFSNVTDEWLVITAAEGECERLGIEAFDLTVTPGHEMLDAFGRFRTAIDIVTSDAQFVREDGRVVKVQFERVTYSAATAHLYEEAEIVVAHTEGGLALQPQMKRGWKTYNFEVETYHTYVAGGRGAWRRECSQSNCLDNPSDLPEYTVQRQAA